MPTIPVSINTSSHNSSFRNIEIASLGGSRFENCDFTSSTLPAGAIVSGVTFVNAVMDKVTWESVQFTYCNFDRCCFDFANLEAASFVNCTFDHVSFYNAQMARVEMVNCTLDESSFSYGDLTKSHFDTVRMDRTRLQCGTLANAQWKGVQISDGAIYRMEISQSAIHNITLIRSAFHNNTVTRSRLVEWTADNVSTIESNVMRENRVVKCADVFTPRTHKCKGCKQDRRLSDFTESKVYCRNCTEMKNYSERNDTWKGKPSRLPAFSFEFEIDDVRGRAEDDPNPMDLLDHDFIHCSDGSVEAEWKSPIYQDERSFVRALPVLDSLSRYVVGTCGTHIHVQFDGDEEKLSRHYARIFGPLQRHMQEHYRETINFWGRDFTGYAGYNQPSSRYNWVNMNLGRPTIEFRLSKFSNAQQYRTLVRFVRRATAYLSQNVTSRGYARADAYDAVGQHLLDMYEAAVKASREPVTA